MYTSDPHETTLIDNINSSLDTNIVLSENNIIETPSADNNNEITKLYRKIALKNYKITKRSLKIVKKNQSAFDRLKLKKSNPKSKKNSTKKKERINSIRSFLEKDENSSMAPGKKDTILKGGVKKQKRFLNDTLYNLYDKYCQEFNLKLSRATFYRLRPFWIIQKKVSARDTCLCKLHTNMKYVVNKLIHLKIINSKNLCDLIKSKTCEIHNKDCFYNECQNCINKNIDHVGSEEKTSYEEWITRDVERLGAKNKIYHVKVTSKVTVECTLSELIKKFNVQLPIFLRHEYDTHHQSQVISLIKDNLSENDVLLVMDFSQNYICKYSEEIHSAHFGASKKQVSLHTGALYYYNTDLCQIDCTTFCGVSECLRHDASAVWAYLQPVVHLIKETVPNVNKIHFQSDGPSTQYKNKYNMFLFRHFCEVFGLNSATWNFTTPGHGKSSADGVGGTVKNMCDRAVANKKDIKCAQDIVNLIENNSKIRMFLILDNDIDKIDLLLDKNIVTVKNTTKIFQIIWTQEEKEKIFLNSLSCSYCIIHSYYHPSCNHFQLKPNSWSFPVQKKNKK